MDFWFYVNPYIQKKDYQSFDSHEVLWDYFMKIQISSSSSNEKFLSVKCFPGYQDFQPTTYFINDDNSATLYHWNYVQCAINLKTQQVFINYNNPSFFAMKLYTSKISSLKIRPGKDAKSNYGFLFIKEVKLWGIFNKEEKNTNCM